MKASVLPHLFRGLSLLLAALLYVALSPSGAEAQTCRPTDLKCRAEAAARKAAEAVAKGANVQNAVGGCSQNNNFQCARPAVLGERIDGAIGGNNRELFYRLAVEQPGVLQFTLNPMPNRKQIILTVTDSQYQQVDRFTFQPGQPGDRVLRLSSPGTYYIRLYDNHGGLSERFSLRVSKTTP